MKIYKALTIAGSDNSGGAGIQADIKTFSAFSVYGMSVITAVTSQNTIGVKDFYKVPIDHIKKQLETICEDIKIDALKTGMLVNEEVVEVVAEFIKRYQLKNLVIDPVIKASKGKDLFNEKAVESYITKLIPYSKIITPNKTEAEMLTGEKINSVDDIKKCAKTLKNYGAKIVIIKGGHIDFEEDIVIDTIYIDNKFIYLKYPKVQIKDTHGTGCTFSAAITANLAKGIESLKSIRIARAYLQGSLENALNVGKGSVSLNHFWLK